VFLQIPVLEIKIGGQEEIEKAMQSYTWREEDFLLSVYPKNGKVCMPHSC